MISFNAPDIEITLPNGEIATIHAGELDLNTDVEAADPSVGAYEGSVTAWAVSGWIEVATPEMMRPIVLDLKPGHPVLRYLNERLAEEMSRYAADEW